MVEPHYLYIYINRTRAILYAWLFANCLLVCSKVYPLFQKSPKTIDLKAQVENYWNIVETSFNNKIHSFCQISQIQPNLKILTKPQDKKIYNKRDKRIYNASFNNFAMICHTERETFKTKIAYNWTSTLCFCNKLT